MIAAQRSVILCIEDYESILIARVMLLENEGYEVLSASDWRNGLQLFASHVVDEVILDYHMPGMTGDLIALKMKEYKPSVPILLVSGDGSLHEDKAKQVDAVLSKTEPVTVFLSAVKSLLNRAKIE